jgi:hypothetical protein
MTARAQESEETKRGNVTPIATYGKVSSNGEEERLGHGS